MKKLFRIQTASKAQHRGVQERGRPPPERDILLLRARLLQRRLNEPQRMCGNVQYEQLSSLRAGCTCWPG